jgi:short-subunit dehydrogenase
MYLIKIFLIACRSKTRAEVAMREVQKTTGSENMTFLEVDLANLKSVRAFVDAFKKTKLPLDILINNAGVNYYKRQ